MKSREQARKSNTNKNNALKKQLVIIGLVTLVLTSLMLAFSIVPNTLYLLTVGFTLENILTDKLPSHYYVTGDGSIFNIVIFETFLLKAVIVSASVYALILIFKHKLHN